MHVSAIKGSFRRPSNGLATTPASRRFGPFARTPSIQRAESVVGSRNELVSAPETSPARRRLFGGQAPRIGGGSEKMHPVAEETHRKADAFFKENAKWAPSGGSKCRIVKHL
jgi:hypothetical protein